MHMHTSSLKTAVLLGALVAMTATTAMAIPMGPIPTGKSSAIPMGPIPTGKSSAIPMGPIPTGQVA